MEVPFDGQVTHHVVHSHRSTKISPPRNIENNV